MKPVTDLERSETININKIAELADVSKATVSRVINDKGNVSKATKEKVLKVIAEHNYTPSTTARDLSHQRSSYIGIVIPDIENNFFSEIIREVSIQAEKEGLSILLFDTNDDLANEYRALRTVLEQKLKGLLITPVSEKDEETIRLLHQVQNSGTPVVLIDRDVKNNPFDAVYIDNFKGAYQATMALLEVGHQHIIAITGPNGSKPSRERLAGYKAAHEDFGVPWHEEDIYEGHFKLEDGYELTKQALKEDSTRRAIFTHNNMMTIGSLKYLLEAGLTIGKDISLVGFDEIEILSWLGVDLTLVNRPTKSMGNSAFNLLLARFQDTKTERQQIIKLPVELILRGSEKLSK